MSVGDPDFNSLTTKALWKWLESNPEPYPPLATNGVAFIALEETGGLAYYQDVTRWPHYPGYQNSFQSRGQAGWPSSKRDVSDSRYSRYS